MATDDWGNGKYVFELFPQEYIDLDRELNTQYHPKLAAIIGAYPADEIDIKLAQIASYCEVILEGDYTLEKRVGLCRILLSKLKEKREDPNGSLIINSTN